MVFGLNNVKKSIITGVLMDKKYKLTSETCMSRGHTLYRIQALIVFGNVTAGNLGGFIEFESNLSQVGNCWVSDNARIFGKARVDEDAQVYGNARVFGDAHVSENARVFGNARVNGEVQIFGHAQVYGKAQVYGNVRVLGDASIYEDSRVSGHAWISGHVQISGDAWISGTGAHGTVWMSRDVKLDHGIWNETVQLNNHSWYVVSTTLKKVLLGY